MTPAERLTMARAEISRQQLLAHAAAEYAPRWMTDHSPTGPQGACCAEGAGVFTATGSWLATVWADQENGEPGHLAMSDHIAVHDPTHTLRVLGLHEELLAACDEWMLSRLDRPDANGLIPRAFNRLLDLYAPALVEAS